MDSKKFNSLVRSMTKTETQKLLDLLYRRKYDKDGNLIKPGKRLMNKGGLNKRRK